MQFLAKNTVFLPIITTKAKSVSLSVFFNRFLLVKIPKNNGVFVKTKRLILYCLVYKNNLYVQQYAIKFCIIASAAKGDLDRATLFGCCCAHKARKLDFLQIDMNIRYFYPLKSTFFLTFYRFCDKIVCVKGAYLMLYLHFLKTTTATIR